MLQVGGPLAPSMAVDLFVSAQSERQLDPETTVVAKLSADFDEFLTWLWLCLRLRFQHRKPSFIPDVEAFLTTCPQLVPAAPVAATPEPETEKKKGKKK